MRRAFLAAIAVVLALPALSAAAGPATTTALAPLDALYPDLEKFYVDLHRNPELSFHEEKTAGRLAGRLPALGYDVTTGVGKTGVVAVMKNGKGPTVLIRADMEALPVEEKTAIALRQRSRAGRPDRRHAGLRTRQRRLGGHHDASVIENAHGGA